MRTIIQRMGKMRIAAYCRVSTTKEEQVDSLEHQKEFFMEYAQKNGHELVQLYADEGISGTSLRHRDEFTRLMKDAELHLFDMLVVKDISRFARNTVDFLQSIRALKRMGVNTLFLTANMESLGESEFVLTVFGALAQEESVNLSKRVKFGKQINARLGRVPKEIFGYDRIDNFTLRINEQEARVVCDIFDLYISGNGLASVARILNEKGYTTKNGLNWESYAIRRILCNSIYYGVYVNNKYEIKDCLEHTRTIRDESEWLTHERPEWAIISKETFDSAQQQLMMRREEYNSKTQKGIPRYSYKHIFSTLIKCGCCGQSFGRKHYETKGKRVSWTTRYYWKCRTVDRYSKKGPCNNSVTLDESVLLTRIKEYLTSLMQDRDAFIQKILNEISTRHPVKPQDDTTQLERQKDILQSKRKKYQEMYASDLMTIDELKIQLKKIASDITDIDYKIKSSKAIISPDDPNGVIAEYRREIERFLNLETVTCMDLKKVIDHIDANPNGEIIIHLKRLA